MKKIWPIIAFILSLLFIMGAVQHITGMRADALGIKCQRLDYTMDQDCLNKARSRNIKMTYVRDLNPTYRRSRAGSNWTNYKNREFTSIKRSETQERNRFKRTYNRLGYYRATSLDTIRRQLQLRRQARAKAQAAKFE